MARASRKPVEAGPNGRPLKVKDVDRLQMMTATDIVGPLGVVVPPAPANDDGLPILLRYQAAWVSDQAKVKVAEKSRRIGLTWAEAFDCVTIAGAEKSAGGMNCFYLGYNLDMAREFIAACAMWAKHLQSFLKESDTGEFLFRETDRAGNEHTIRAFRISFLSGYSIIALPSRPRSLRGMQGVVILDEAAFHDDIAGMMKAAFALLIWGGKVRVISTHFGADNPFNELILDIRADRKPYSLHRITFDDAIADGLGRRVATTLGDAWSADWQKTWRDEIYAIYVGNEDEELDCIPSQGGDAYFTLAALELIARKGVPIIRWALDDAFARLPDSERKHAALIWSKVALAFALASLPRDDPSAIGVDFARSGDLTVIWVFQTTRDNRRRTALVIELRNVPFTEQETVCAIIVEGVPRFQAMKLDATGNGAYLAERMQQRFGVARVEAVKLSADWYIDNFPRLKAAVDDRTADVPDDRDIFADFRLVKLIKGVPRVPENARNVEKGGKKGQRHGDGAIAAVLSYAASRAEPFSVGYEAPKGRPSDVYEPSIGAAGKLHMLPEEVELPGDRQTRPRETW